LIQSTIHTISEHYPSPSRYYCQVVRYYYGSNGR